MHTCPGLGSRAVSRLSCLLHVPTFMPGAVPAMQGACVGGGPQTPPPASRGTLSKTHCVSATRRLFTEKRNVSVYPEILSFLDETTFFFGPVIIQIILSRSLFCPHPASGWVVPACGPSFSLSGSEEPSPEAHFLCEPVMILACLT